MAILDATVTALNVIAAGIALAMAGSAFSFQRRRLAVWDDRAPWLGPLVGALHAVLMLAIFGAIYWVGYRVAGFPQWMRWIVG